MLLFAGSLSSAVVPMHMYGTVAGGAHMPLIACTRQLHAGADAMEAPSARASAAPNLANAPHDGPDEPLLLRYDPGGGASSFLCSHIHHLSIPNLLSLAATFLDGCLLAGIQAALSADVHPVLKTVMVGRGRWNEVAVCRCATS